MAVVLNPPVLASVEEMNVTSAAEELGQTTAFADSLHLQDLEVAQAVAEVEAALAVE